MKILKNGELIDGDVSATFADTIAVHDNYIEKRKRAYEEAGITFQVLIELQTEIAMYENDGNTLKAMEKQAEYDALLQQKSNIKNLYPKP